MLKRIKKIIFFALFIASGFSLLSCSGHADERWKLPGKVVFNTWRGPGPFTLAILEKGNIKILSLSGSRPKLSPSGELILTIGDTRGPYIYTTDGELVKHFEFEEHIGAWDWFGSDEKILIVEITAQPAQYRYVYNLVNYDVNSGDRTIVTRYSRLNSITDVDVSPDGTKVAITRSWEDVPRPSMNIYLLDLTTSEEIEIDTRSSDARFSQDGKKILYDKLIVDKQGRPSIQGSHIMVYDVPTGKKKPIVDRPLSGKSFNLSKDGKMLIFSDDDSILKLNVETGKLTQMLDKPLVKGSSYKYVKDSNPDWHA